MCVAAGPEDDENACSGWAGVERVRFCALWGQDGEEAEGGGDEEGCESCEEEGEGIEGGWWGCHGGIGVCRDEMDRLGDYGGLLRV